MTETWKDEGCVPPKVTPEDEIKALEDKLAFLESGIKLYFGVHDPTIRGNMLEQVELLRDIIQTLKAQTIPRTTELL